MTPTALLRLCSACYLIFFLGHTTAMFSEAARGPAELAVFTAMKAYSFDMMGVQRTHMDFYVGEGWYLSLFAGMFVVLTWMLGAMARNAPQHARALVVVMTIVSALSALLNWVWFFPAPAVTSTLGTAALGVAAFKLRS